MPVKFTFNMSFADIDAGIESTKKRGQKIRDDLHKMNVSVLARWLETGDVRQPVAYATKLVNETDYHSQAIADWFSNFAGFRWDAENKCFTHTVTTIDMEVVKNAKAMSFEKYSPPKAVKAVDLLADLDRILTKGAKRVQETDDQKKSAEDKVTQEEVAIAQEARRQIAALREGARD